ncbi:MAG: NADAR family protein [Bacteroidota bacterium]
MQIRTYIKKDVVSFRSTKATFGGLSNMAAGYSIFVNSIFIKTSEALYQACKFPEHPDVQHAIITQHSPITAKKISRKNQQLVRHDWDDIRVKVMRWCLQVKLAQNWDTFSRVLKSTGSRAIVEYTKEDKIWGATDIGGGKIQGVNALGRLLMELRERHVMQGEVIQCVEPPKITNFILFENQIDWVCDETNDVFDLGSTDVEHIHTGV